MSRMPKKKAVVPTPMACAMAPSPSEASGMEPMASSWIPSARPCMAGSVVINTSAVWSTPKLALIKPMHAINANESGTACDRLKSAQRVPHVAVPRTKSPPWNRKLPIMVMMSESVKPPRPLQVSSHPEPAALGPRTSLANTGMNV